MGGGTKVLKAELEKRVTLMNAAKRQTRLMRDEQSVEHGAVLAKDFARAFEITARGPEGPVAAMDRTVDGVLEKVGRMRPAGAEVIAESTLEWTREAARRNPALRDEYERLTEGIEKRFSRLGRRVTVVNTDVRTGSQREWKGVRLALTSQTERAREKVTRDFTEIQNKAVGSLTSMGFSAGDARAMVRGIERGGASATRARVDAANRGPTGTGQRLTQSDANRPAARAPAPSGDGLGHGPTTFNLHGPQTTSTDARRYSLGVNSTRIGISGVRPDQPPAPRPRMRSTMAATPTVLVPPPQSEVRVVPEINLTFRGDFRGDRVDKQRVVDIVNEAAGKAFDEFALKVDDEIHSGSEVDAELIG